MAISRPCRQVLLALCVIVGPTVVAHAQPAEPAVIRFYNRDIAILRATLGPVDPQDRVEAIAGRLSEFTPSDLRQPVTVVPYDDARAIVVGERVLFVLVHGDVDPTLGETVDAAAAQAADNLRNALTSWADQRRPQVIARGVIHVLAATIVGSLLLLVLARLRRLLSTRLTPRAERAIERRSVVVFGQDLRHACVKTIRFAANVLHVFAAILVLYAWLVFSLSRFPLTQPWSEGQPSFCSAPSA